jgi:hypothetical protein
MQNYVDNIYFWNGTFGQWEEWRLVYDVYTPTENALLYLLSLQINRYGEDEAQRQMTGEVFACHLSSRLIVAVLVEHDHERQRGHERLQVNP